MQSVPIGQFYCFVANINHPSTLWEFFFLKRFLSPTTGYMSLAKKKIVSKKAPVAEVSDSSDSDGNDDNMLQMLKSMNYTGDKANYNDDEFDISDDEDDNEDGDEDDDEGDMKNFYKNSSTASDDEIDEFGSDSEELDSDNDIPVKKVSKKLPEKQSKKPKHSTPSSDDDDDEFDETFGADGEDLTELQSQLKSLAKDEDAALFREKKNVETDRRKAKHVANQQKLWQTALQFRLRSQHPLTLAQRIPSPELLPYFASPEGVSPTEGSKVGHQKLCIAAAVTAQTLGDLIETERELSRVSGSVSASRCHDISYEAPELCTGLTAMARKKYEKRSLEDGSVGPNKRFKTAVDRDLDNLEHYLSQAWEKSLDVRSKIMDKWGKRVQVASGKTELGSTGLSASLSQPLSVQISQTIDVESDRFVARTRLRRSTIASLGAAPVDARRDAHEDEEERDARLRAARFDPQIFDDSDFYSVLLREMTLSAEAVGTGLSAAAEAQADLMRRTKLIAKNIDRKASKGRKIRFVPIPKLVNFMVPIVTPQWLAACATATEGTAVGDAQETLVDELLEGLFGQGTRLEPSKLRADAEAQEVSEDENPSDDEDAEESESQESYGEVDEELYGDFEVVDENTNLKEASKDFHLDPNVRRKSKQFTDGDKSDHLAWFNSSKKK